MRWVWHFHLFGSSPVARGHLSVPLSLQPVEVPTMLSELRQQRMLMVQTISQYKFVYQVLIQFLKNSRLI